jgi:hypothetical protein
MSLTLKADELAYLDSLTAGLVPCRVLKIFDGEYGKSALVRFTAARGCWSRGQQYEAAVRRVVPRAAVIRRRSMSGPRILPYVVEASQ